MLKNVMPPRHKYTIDGDLVEEIEITLPDKRKIKIETHGSETLYLPNQNRREFKHKQIWMGKEEDYSAYYPEEGTINIMTPEGYKPILWVAKRERE